MKKEELVALGLSEEQIASVFKINGLDIENAKGDLKAKESENESIKNQLLEANKQIETFKTLDIESIKSQAEEYKTKFEESEAKAKAELDRIMFDHEVENLLKEKKAKNVVAVRALIDLESLRESKNRTQDLESMIEKIREANDYLFDDADSEEDKGKPDFTRPTGKTKTVGMTKEEFKKLQYRERVAIYNENPDLYKSLSE